MKSRHRHEAYLGLMSCFAGGLILYGAARRRRDHVERPLSWSDLLLLGVATHKISRIIAEDRVTSPLRAPFQDADQEAPLSARQASPSAHLERSSARQETHPVWQGFRSSVGELLTCPYCLAPWVSLTLHWTHCRFPQSSRAVSSIFAVVSVSDFINRAYGRIEHT